MHVIGLAVVLLLGFCILMLCWWLFSCKRTQEKSVEYKLMHAVRTGDEATIRSLLTFMSDRETDDLLLQAVTLAVNHSRRQVLDLLLESRTMDLLHLLKLAAKRRQYDLCGSLAQACGVQISHYNDLLRTLSCVNVAMVVRDLEAVEILKSLRHPIVVCIDGLVDATVASLKMMDVEHDTVISSIRVHCSSEMNVHIAISVFQATMKESPDVWQRYQRLIGMPVGMTREAVLWDFERSAVCMKLSDAIRCLSVIHQSKLVEYCRRMIYLAVLNNDQSLVLSIIFDVMQRFKDLTLRRDLLVYGLTMACRHGKLDMLDQWCVCPAVNSGLILTELYRLAAGSNCWAVGQQNEQQQHLLEISLNYIKSVCIPLLQHKNH